MSGGAGATDFIIDASGVDFVAGNGGVGTKSQCSAVLLICTVSSTLRLYIWKTFTFHCTVASAPVGAVSERLIGILRIPNKNAEKNI